LAVVLKAFARFWPRRAHPAARQSWWDSRTAAQAAGERGQRAGDVVARGGEVGLNLLQAGRLRVGAALQRGLLLNLQVEQLVADALQPVQRDAAAANLAAGLIFSGFSLNCATSRVYPGVLALAMLLLVASSAPCVASSACMPINSDVFNPPMAITSGRTRSDVSTWGQKPPEIVL
jgi:hypothetical protein